MDVSAVQSVPASRAAYGNGGPSGTSPAAAATTPTSNGGSPLSPALSDAPSAPQSEIIAQVAQLPADIRYAPSSPPHAGRPAPSFDRRA